MQLLVVPFTTTQLDPDALALARYCTLEAADALGAALLADELEVTVEALSVAAAALGADAALGATLRLTGAQVELDVLTSEGVSLHQSLPLGTVPQVGRVLAQVALDEESVEPELVLRLARATLNEDLDELLALGQLARRRLLAVVRAGQGGPRTPALHSALEQYVEDHPDDVEALLLLAASRAEHLDDPGARELYLRAREAGAELQALQGLAGLALAAGRSDEAVAHLRSAVKLTDDARLYSALGALLLDREPAEAISALTRAAVLSPRDPQLQLDLARALRKHGSDAGRLLAAISEVLRLSQGSPEIRAAAAELIASLG
ncbi:MAG TPA: hypothetical protein VH083_27565 [Myxococcales bacterium]|nr:hypothetical protein [Myxococcales bacterium]